MRIDGVGRVLGEWRPLLVYGMSRQADIITSEVVDEVLQDMASYGVFGPDSEDAAREGPEPKRRGQALMELPELGSESNFDSSAARALFGGTRKRD